MNNLAQHLTNLSETKRELLISELKKRGILEPIAIIGIGCRFPGGVFDTASYWELLVNGVDAITEVPPERWDINSFYDPNPATPGKMVTRYGGFLKQIDQFDPAFFHISPREAISLDPQQRLLMEVAWEAFEDAGLVPQELAGSNTGVFVGISTYDYGQKQLAGQQYDAYAGTGSVLSIAANRLSYLFDLRGPSLSVDTACSSSLVALHLACQSLWQAESSLALVGGVNAMLSPALTVNFTKAGFMSPDGRCKSFDSRANGYVRGEGCGLILLKPLSQALTDNNHIYSVIRGTAINQDGHTNGLTAPNRYAQEMLLRKAYKNANISPGLVQYIEAHGTGTPLGDPIEVQALAAVLSIERSPTNYCALGSVKSNIGHLEAAAGVAGIIKTSLCLKHRTLTPNLHFQSPNPKIDFDKLPLRVQTKVSEWPIQDQGTYAGVSSFGFGGTNAHIVLESPPKREVAPSNEYPVYILPISAHNEKSLRSLAERYLKYFQYYDLNLTDLCYTASCKRTHHQTRLAIVAESREQFQEKLKAFLSNESRPGLSNSQNALSKKPKVVFVCSGQGQQWWAMARKLLSSNAIFRAKFQECDVSIKTKAGWSLLEEFQSAESLSKINKTEIAQPAIFAIQVGLAAVWQHWGVNPQVVVGHSVGEIAAAYIAGAISLASAITIVLKRGQLMERTYGQGKTAVIGLSREQVQQVLSSYPNVSVAAYNSPSSSLISGLPNDIDQIIAQLEAKGVFCRLLKVSYAFHSSQMDPLLPEFERELTGLQAQETSIPIYSTVTGNVIKGSELDAKYWGRNLREPVLFNQAINQLLSQDYNVFIELAATPVLSAAINDCLYHQQTKALVVSSLKRGEEDHTYILSSLASVYANGCTVDWSKIYPKGNLVSLPQFCWDRQRFWSDSDVSNKIIQNSIFSNIIRVAVKPSMYVWEAEWSVNRDHYLANHVVMGQVVVAGATYISTLLTALVESWQNNFSIEAVEFYQPLFLSRTETVKVQLIVTMGENQKAQFQFTSLQKLANQENWVTHVKGQVSFLPIEKLPKINIDTLDDGGKSVSKEAFYKKLNSHGLELGPAFQGIGQIKQKKNQAFATIQANGLAAENHYFYIHPGLIDSFFQTLLSALDEEDPRYPENTTFVPVKLAKIISYKKPGLNSVLYAQARINLESTNTIIKGDVDVYDQTGDKVLSILGLQAQNLHHKETFSKYQRWFYEINWVAQKGDFNSKPLNLINPQKWLILANHTPISDTLFELATKAGCKTIRVYPGQDYKLLSENVYQVNVLDKKGFKQILEVCKAEGYQTIVDLWGLDINPSKDNWLTDIERLGCLPIINLIQTINEIDWPRPPRFFLVTQESQNLEPVIVNPGQRAVWGLINAVNYEHPEYLATRIDLASQPSLQDLEILCNEIFTRSNELQIVVKNQQRYVAKLVLSSLIKTNNNNIAIKADCSYLITGGTKGLGLVVAQWLASQGARNLILVGRNAPSSNSLAVIEKLRSQGVRVLVEGLDVANKIAINSLISKCNDTLPPLKGIIHAAGVLADTTIVNMDEERFNQALQSKILGGWHLHIATLEQKLDFFINFSSVASLIGALGQSNYVTANAFLDGLAHYRRSLALPATAINWGPWSEVGMAALDNRGIRLSTQGLASISQTEGCEILDLVLQNAPIQIGVMNFNAEQWRQSYPQSSASFFEALISQDNSQKVTVRQQIEALPLGTARRSMLEDYVRQQLAKILKISAASIGLDDSLSKFGLDSLMSVELKNRLESDLSLNLSVTLVWNYPTLSALVEFLAKEIGLGIEVLPLNSPTDKDKTNLLKNETSKTLDVLAKIKLLEKTLSKIK